MIRDEQDARAFVASRSGPEAIERLEALAAALGEENARQNLVSARSLDHLWQRHFADSAQLLDHVPRETGHWLDLGSGAGFPGLVIAAMRPQQAITLVESRKRRVEWLISMAEALDLAHCRVEGRRLELVETVPAGVITARAFAPLEKLLRLSARFSTADTHWVLPKGRSGAVELESISSEWRQMFHVEQSKTDPEAVILVGKGKIRGGSKA